MPYFRAVATLDSPAPAQQQGDLGGTKLIVGYAVVAVFLVVAIAVSVSIGRDERGAAGDRRLLRRRELRRVSASASRSTSRASSSTSTADAGGKLRLRDDELTGDVDCVDGGTGARRPRGHRRGRRPRSSSGTVGGEPVTATFAEELPEPGTSAKPRGEAQRRGDVRPADARDRRRHPRGAPRRRR